MENFSLYSTGNVTLPNFKKLLHFGNKGQKLSHVKNSL